MLNAAADLNTYERDNIAYLHDVPTCGARRTSSTSVGSGATVAISLTTEDFDTDSMHSTVTNPSRITLNETAVWMINGWALWEASTQSVLFQTMIRENATTLLSQQSTLKQATVSLYQHVTCIREFTSGDYLEVVCNHDSGVAENVSLGGLSVVRLRDG